MYMLKDAHRDYILMGLIGLVGILAIYAISLMGGYYAKLDLRLIEERKIHKDTTTTVIREEFLYQEKKGNVFCNDC